MEPEKKVIPYSGVINGIGCRLGKVSKFIFKFFRCIYFVSKIINFGLPKKIEKKIDLYVIKVLTLKNRQEFIPKQINRRYNLFNAPFFYRVD